MDKGSKIIFGNWIGATGTIVSAIASTPPIIGESTAANELNLIGNVLQGTGNAVEADAIELLTLTKIANEIRAIGNSTVVIGILIYFEDDLGERLIITGNWLQALGSLLVVIDEFSNQRTVEVYLIIVGNFLQAIGNSLQSIGGIIGLRGNEELGKPINTSGSWIQATGSVLSALVSTSSVVREA